MRATREAGEVQGGEVHGSGQATVPEPPQHQRRLARGAAFTAAMVVVGLLIAVLGTRDHGDPVATSEGPLAPNEKPVPLVLPDAAASEFDRVAAIDSTDDQSTDDDARVWEHVPEGDTEPWSTVVVESLSPPRQYRHGVDTVDLGVVDGIAVSSDGVNEVVWPLDDSTRRVLTSSDVSELGLVALARSAVESGSPPGELPGYVAIAEPEPWMQLLVTGEMSGDEVPAARLTMYRAEGAPAELLQVVTVPGSMQDWQALEALLPGAETVVVRGTSAMVTVESLHGIDGAMSVVTVAWMEDDDTVAFTVSSGPLAGDAHERAIAFVGALETLDEEAWDAFLVEHGMGDG